MTYVADNRGSAAGRVMEGEHHVTTCDTVERLLTLYMYEMGTISETNASIHGLIG